MTHPETPYRLLIVDDSKAMCKFLESVLSAHPGLEVVGVAHDPFEAREMVKRLNPHAITLDIEMPRMDGLTFLKNLMRLHPLPVVMISSLTAAGASLTLQALEIGAVDFLVKRHPGSQEGVQAYVEEIRDTVFAACSVTVLGAADARGPRLRNPDLVHWRSLRVDAGALSRRLKTIVAVGASTGGPQALKSLLDSAHCPDTAFLIVQHMPTQFLYSLAERLDSTALASVKVAEHGTRVEPGTALIAPGDVHMVLVRADGDYYCHLEKDDRGLPHVPSVDVLFESVRRATANRSVGLLLTGMGTDGAKGLLTLREAGALTLVQDQPSSAVWGMPGEAVALGAAVGQVPLQSLGATLSQLMR